MRGSWPPPSNAWTSHGSRTARRRRTCTYPAARNDAAELLVLTCDATGVNMIPSGLRDTTRATAETHAAAGLP